MKLASVKRGGKKPLPGRIHRYQQRFLTGITLGIVLVLAVGSFVPLLAHPHDWVGRQVIAQGLFDQNAPSDPVEQNAPSNSVPPPNQNPAIPVPVMPTDIEEYWARNCIQELALNKLIPINEQAKFHPDQPATWEFMQSVLNQNFPTGEPYAGASPVEAALRLPSAVNVLYSYPPRYFEAERPVTRTDAVTALVAKLGLPYMARANDLLNSSLSDGRKIPAYGREAVASALGAGKLLNYKEPQAFAGERTVTRGEMAAFVCQARNEAIFQNTIAPAWIAQPQPLPTQPQPEQELRGVWLTNIDSEVLFSKEVLAQAVQRLKALHINTLYPVVWNMGYTQYPSRIAERWLGKKRQLWPGEHPSFEANQGDRDMLQELIELAHAEGMTVIPWFEFGFMAPANYDVLTQHPDWFTQRLDGTLDIPMGEEVFTWMNPFHPQTQRLLLLLMAEVLENYDVEGLQVDDHLGMPVDMGYDPYTINLYQQDHDGQSPPTDYADPEWIAWRANRISQFMGEVRRLIDQRKPDGILSVSPNPYPFSYVQYLQDWPTWEKAGLLDEIVIQVYRDDLDRFIWELNKPATVAASKTTRTSIGLLSGLRGRPTDINLLTEQLESVRDRGYAGVSYFFYQSLWTPGQETLEQRETQLRSSFSKPVQRP